MTSVGLIPSLVGVCSVGRGVVCGERRKWERDRLKKCEKGMGGRWTVGINMPKENYCSYMHERKLI